MKKMNRVSYYVRIYKAKSIFIKNLIAISLILILPFLALLIFSLVNMRTSIYNNIENTNKYNLLNGTNIINSRIDRIKYTSLYIASLNEVKTFSHISNKDFLTNEQYQNIDKILQSLRIVNEEIESIYIYSNKNNLMIPNIIDSDKTSNYEKEWVKNLIIKQVKEPEIYFRSKYGNYPYLITVYVPIILNKTEITGAVIVNLDVEKFDDFLNFTSDSEFFILDESDNIIYSKNYSLINKNMYNTKYKIINNNKSNEYGGRNKKYIYSTLILPYNNWKCILFTSMDKYSRELSRLPLLIVVYIFIAIFMSLVFSIIITFTTSKPFTSLLKIFNKKEPSNEYESEIDYLANMILNAINENELLEETLKKRVELFNNSQMIALQAQINPHFLYNTLDNIKWSSMELTGGNNKVSKSIEQLGKLLRFSLQIQPKFICILEEKKYIEIYIDIINKRRNCYCKLIWDIEEDCYNYKVPRLILQPIVENAIKHGIRQKGKGTIVIKMSCKQKFIFISVIDDGNGIELEQLDKLNNKLKDTDNIYHKHIGLVNVVQRMKLLMGEECSIFVKSTKGVGTEVILKILQTIN